jgi:hypothetical protein
MLSAIWRVLGAEAFPLQYRSPSHLHLDGQSLPGWKAPDLSAHRRLTTCWQLVRARNVESKSLAAHYSCRRDTAFDIILVNEIKSLSASQSQRRQEQSSHMTYPASSQPRLTKARLLSSPAPTSRHIWANYMSRSPTVGRDKVSSVLGFPSRVWSGT